MIIFRYTDGQDIIIKISPLILLGHSFKLFTKENSPIPLPGKNARDDSDRLRTYLCATQSDWLYLDNDVKVTTLPSEYRAPMVPFERGMPDCWVMYSFDCVFWQKMLSLLPLTFSSEFSNYGQILSGILRQYRNELTAFPEGLFIHKP